MTVDGGTQAFQLPFLVGFRVRSRKRRPSEVNLFLRLREVTLQQRDFRSRQANFGARIGVARKLGHKLRVYMLQQFCGFLQLPNVFPTCSHCVPQSIRTSHDIGLPRTPSNHP